MGDLSASIQIADEVTKVAEKENKQRIYIDALLTKVYCLWQLYDNEIALNLCGKIEKKLKSSKKDERYWVQYGNLRHLEGNIYESIGNFKKAIELHSESLGIFKKIGNERKIAQILNNLGFITSLIGDTTKADNLLSKALDMSREYGNLQDIAQTMKNLGILHFQKGNYSKSLECLEKGLEIQLKINNPFEISQSYLELIQLTLFHDERDKALEYYGKFNLFGQEHEHEIIKLRMKICHAILLKGEKRFRSKVEAAFILEEILNEETLQQMYSITALNHIAEIKLEELEYFEEESILDEFEDIILQLQQEGRKQNSILIISEANLLLSKIFLIRGKIQEAKNMLIRTQNFAESHGLNHLALNISNLYDHLLIHMSFRDKVDPNKKSNFRERINQAEIFTFLRNLQRNKLKVEKIGNEEPIMFMVLDKEGEMKASIKFSKNGSLDSNLINSFVSTISMSLDNDLFVDSDVKRLESNEYTLLLKRSNGFTFCYICKGQSYYAIKKLRKTIDKLSEMSEYHDLVERWKQADYVKQTLPAIISQLIRSLFLKDTSI